MGVPIVLVSAKWARLSPVKKAAILAFAADRDRIPAEIQCPQCGSVCTHLIGAAVEQNGMVDVAEHDELDSVELLDGFGRGSGVAIIFACEDGHAWSEVTRFHKGTCLRHEVLLPLGLLDITRDELWRD